MNEENINISEVLEVFKKKYKLILGVVIAFVALASVLSFFVITPKYEAKVKLFIGKEEGENKLGYDNSEIQMYQKLLTTYAEIIKTEDLISNAVAKKGIDLEGKDPSSILKALVVTPRSDTQILEISYQDTNATRARDIVDCITQEFIGRSKELITNGNVQIIQEAKIPETPISPNKKVNIAIAGILGIMVGIGTVLLLEFMDNTFKNKEDLEKVLDLPVLGAISHYELESKSISKRERKKQKMEEKKREKIEKKEIEEYQGAKNTRNGEAKEIEKQEVKGIEELKVELIENQGAKDIDKQEMKNREIEDMKSEEIEYVKSRRRRKDRKKWR